MTIAFASSAQARRVALVIGNQDYGAEALNNPVADARLIGSTLKDKLHFDVVEVHENVKHRELQRLIDQFGDLARGADAAVFYFSGHGMQDGDQSNYLIPVGAHIEMRADLKSEAVAVSDLMVAVRQARPGVALVVLDACRNSPFLKERGAGDKGLARLTVSGGGTLIAYATQEQSVAQDGPKGGNSPYAKSLAAHLVQADRVPVLQMLDDVMDDVTAATQGSQVPTRYGDLKVTAVLVPQVGVRVPLSSPDPARIPSGAMPGVPGGVDLGDLEAEEKARKSWEEWLGKMRADFDKVSKFQGSAASKVKAWDRFLATWKDEDPYSHEDRQMRSRAGELQAEAQRAAAALGAGTGAVPTVAPSAAIPAARHEDKGFRDCAECPEMVRVPAGRFEMGAREGAPDRTDEEGPAHDVAIGAFALGKFVVTQGQWRALMGNNPSYFTGCGDNCPVEQVSWDEAQAYIKKLIERTGKPYRLPSEAEWEYACRSGSHQTYCGGDRIDAVAWYSDGHGGSTRPVGRKQANAWGLYDMSGNVWQWVQDCWHESYAGAPADGRPWTGLLGMCVNRVVRGGSWDNVSVGVRATWRSRNASDGRDNTIGFRIARALP